ncbi:MAG TPA: ATP-binding cassette domain-containing protein [Candidatus Omnitrophota bacterium]|jgi:phospholipid/cholesterol/gamma-HCH transport system ATP-binding protein|nr:ATP-binding cassette domain-containing protein [Candidatus Omnitrophota bacterium]
MIRVEGLVKSFAKQRVLDEVDLQVKDGEILVILGESGSGKSVLLRHLIGLEVPDQGKVFIKDVDITVLPESKLLKVRRDIGYLFQDGALYDFMSVEENVAFPLLEHTKISEKEAYQKVHELLEMVGLSSAKTKLPSELSGGMRKRAALARAVVLGSKIVLCDEPTSGLDPIKSREISDLIKEVSRRFKSTMVITSHDMMNAFRIADRLVLLKNGKIRIEGSPRDLKESKDSFLQEFLTDQYS